MCTVTYVVSYADTAAGCQTIYVGQKKNVSKG